MEQIRVFLANAKDDTPEMVEQLKNQAERLLKATWPAAEVVVTSGKEDYERNIEQCRSQSGSNAGWDAWISNVAAGVIYPSYQPRYHCCVCPNLQVGKATSSIVHGFLFSGKPVYLLGTNGVTPIKQCQVINSRDYQRGWLLVPEVSGGGSR